MMFSDVNNSPIELLVRNPSCHSLFIATPDFPCLADPVENPPIT